MKYKKRDVVTCTQWPLDIIVEENFLLYYVNCLSMYTFKMFVYKFLLAYPDIDIVFFHFANVNQQKWARKKSSVKKWGVDDPDLYTEKGVGSCLMVITSASYDVGFQIRSLF